MEPAVLLRCVLDIIEATKEDEESAAQARDGRLRPFHMGRADALSEVLDLVRGLDWGFSLKLNDHRQVVVRPLVSGAA